MISLIQHFEADFPQSQPQNPEFRDNPENVNPCRQVANTGEYEHKLPRYVYRINLFKYTEIVRNAQVI